MISFRTTLLRHRRTRAPTRGDHQPRAAGSSSASCLALRRWFCPSAGIGVAKIRGSATSPADEEFDKLASARAPRRQPADALPPLRPPVACLWWLIGFHAGPLGWPYAASRRSSSAAPPTPRSPGGRAPAAFATDAAVANQTLLEQLYQEEAVVPLGKPTLTAVYWALGGDEVAVAAALAHVGQVYASIVVLTRWPASSLKLVTAMIASYDKSKASSTRRLAPDVRRREAAAGGYASR